MMRGSPINNCSADKVISISGVKATGMSAGGIRVGISGAGVSVGGSVVEGGTGNVSVAGAWIGISVGVRVAAGLSANKNLAATTITMIKMQKSAMTPPAHQIQDGTRDLETAGSIGGGGCCGDDI